MSTLPATRALEPNLADYERARTEFSWDIARRELDGLPDGALNIGHEAVDRHANGPRSGRRAIRFLRKDGTTRELTFAERACRPTASRVPCARSALPAEIEYSRCSAAHRSCTSRRSEPSRAAACSRRFSPRSGRNRCGRACRSAGARVLVTTPSLYARKVAPIRDRLPTLRDVLLVGAPGEADAIEGAVDLTTALAAASADFDIVHTTP